MTNKPYILIVMLALLAVIFAWAVFIPKESVTEKINKTLQEQKNKSDMFMKGVTFSEIVNGVKYWEIRSVTSEVNNSTGIADLNQINGAFFKNGKPSVKFISPKVQWDMNKKSIRIETPLGFDKKYKFETSYLDWSLSTKKMFTDRDVVFEGDNLIVTARGLSSDAGLETMVLKGGPKARIRQDGEVLEIGARVFEINGGTGSILASGEAKAVRGDLFIRSESLFYDKGKNNASAIKSVRVIYKDIRAWSDFAVYDIVKNTVLLSGSARAVRGEDELTGDRLIIDLKNNKIMIKGRTKVVVDEDNLTREAR